MRNYSRCPRSNPALGLCSTAGFGGSADFFFFIVSAEGFFTDKPGILRMGDFGERGFSFGGGVVGFDAAARDDGEGVLGGRGALFSTLRFSEEALVGRGGRSSESVASGDGRGTAFFFGVASLGIPDFLDKASVDFVDGEVGVDFFVSVEGFDVEASGAASTFALASSAAAGFSDFSSLPEPGDF